MKNTKINIDKLNDELFEVLHDNPGLLDEVLREEGYDPTELGKTGVMKIKALLFKQKVALKKAQQGSLYARAIAAFESAQASSKEAILQLLQERSPRLQFNKLEKMDENDLREILNESDLLDLMEKIERNQF